MPKMLVALGLITGLALSTRADADGAKKAEKVEANRPTPNPKWTPQQVVRIQLNALKHNDAPHVDAGIETTFDFASRTNKRATGPLERFAKIVKSPAYRPMIEHESATLGVFFLEKGVANQRVTVVDQDGETIIYLFTLAKDPDTGCWMTESVTIPPTVEA